MSWCQNVSVPEYLVVIMSGCQKGGCQSVLVSKCPVPKCRRTILVNRFTGLLILMYTGILRCTRPPQSQSGAIFCHLNHHCVVFKSAR